MGAGAASATMANVAILSAIGSSGINDVVAKIQPNAPFLNITVIDVHTSTPTLATLETYTALMVIGDLTFADQKGLGDNLGNYLDDGHGLIITALTNVNAGCFSGYQLCGNLNSWNYWAIRTGPQILNSRATLGQIMLPNDPILAGVSAGAAGFDGGSLSTRIAATLGPGAELIANWSDGTPFAARRTILNGGNQATEIALNFFPVSSDNTTGDWVSTTQGGKIMANAFNELAGVSGAPDASGVPEPGTYLVVGSGLGLVALLMRRRRTLQCESVQRSRRP